VNRENAIRTFRALIKELSEPPLLRVVGKITGIKQLLQGPYLAGVA